MARLLFGLGVAAVIFTIYAVADCAFFDRMRIRGLRRGWWIVVILFVPIIGGLLWFIIGRGARGRIGSSRGGTSPPTTTPTSCAAAQRRRAGRAHPPLGAGARRARRRRAPQSEDPDRRRPCQALGAAGPTGRRGIRTGSTPRHARTERKHPERPTHPVRRSLRPTEWLIRRHRSARPGRSPASDRRMALLSAFVREGVRDVVVAPGSRSQALALAAAELERVGAIRLHVRIDERGARSWRSAPRSSRAAGRGRHDVGHRGREPAPAVLEAHHSGVPLIICSADRPAELRGIRSNQTTMQPGIFAGAVRLERDVAAPEGAPGEADAATASPARPSTRRSAATRGRPGAAPGPGPCT
jgi:hypothetical protein